MMAEGVGGVRNLDVALESALSGDCEKKSGHHRERWR